MNENRLDSLAIVDDDFVDLSSIGVCEKLESYLENVHQILDNSNEQETSSNALVYLISKISDLIIEESSPNFNTKRDQLLSLLNKSVKSTSNHQLVNYFQDFKREIQIIKDLANEMSLNMQMLQEKLNNASLHGEQMISIRSKTPIQSVSPKLQSFEDDYQEAKHIKNELKNLSEHLMELNEQFKRQIDDMKTPSLTSAQELLRNLSDYKCLKCNCEISRDAISNDQFNTHVLECNSSTKTCIFCFKLFTDYSHFYEHIHAHLD